MNMQIITNSKNPLMCIGMFIMSICLRTVSNSSITNTTTAKNSSFHGIKCTLLSRTGVLKSLINRKITIITRPRLYSGAVCARLSARLILRILLLCLFV